MLIFFKPKLVFFSVPKTGTTAYEIALRRWADIAMPRRTKHMNVSQFHKRMLPNLQDLYNLTPEGVAVIRNPVDQIRSWYKYRSRDTLEDNPRSTANMTFDEFVLDVVSGAPTPAARIGSQMGMLTLRNGDMPVHHLFAYDHQPLLLTFLQDRFDKPVKLKVRNASPAIAAPLSPDVEAKLRKVRAAEFALYNRVLDAGGALHTAP